MNLTKLNNHAVLQTPTLNQVLELILKTIIPIYVYLKIRFS
jgi:hypothetical protein